MDFLIAIKFTMMTVFDWFIYINLLYGNKTAYIVHCMYMYVCCIVLVAAVMACNVTPIHDECQGVYNYPAKCPGPANK